jgi:glutamyl-tRNA reductase
MDRIGVVGISWRSGGPEALKPFSRGPEERARLLPGLARHLGVGECFYLATCNRVEVGFVGDGRPLAEYRPLVFSYLAGREPEPGEARRTFRAWVGEGAVEHILLVCAGLDSAKVGETEIAGQVRESLKHARAAGLCRTRLGLVLEEALKVTGRVHTSTGVSSGRVSLAEIALDRVRERLRDAPQPRVALVGVSAMTERCARSLAAEGVQVVVVNRTLARADELAAAVGGQALALDAFLADPPALDAVVLATGAAGPILSRSVLERLAARTPSSAAPLVVDMAVDPDVAPADAEAASVPRVGLDEVVAEAASTREQRLVELAEARLLVDEALVSLRSKMSARVLGPVVAGIQRRYQETAEKGLERLFNKHLSGLGPEQREATRKWAQTLARRFAHLPSEGLKGVAFEVGLKGVEAFLSRGDPELLDSLWGPGAPGADEAAADPPPPPSERAPDEAR